MTKRLALLLFLVATAAGWPAAAAAQPASPAEEQNANATRERLRQILDQYPPSVRQVLRCDPSLLSKPDYLASYPTLAAYVGQHPEVAHNSLFFLSGGCGATSGFGAMESRSQVAISVQEIFVGLEVMIGVMFGIGSVAWLMKAGLDYRRWQRALKIQTEAHSKIVDRLASNEDLLAYIQSPAGQRFLNASGMAPAAVERMPTPMTAPVNRILWSVQVGIVLAVAGAGLWIARTGVIDEVAQALQVLAVLVMALGIGFVLSALAAYALSRQLGLVGQPSDHA